MSGRADILFEQAMALEPDARAAFIHEASADDPQLREELMSLLHDTKAADQFFERLSDAVFAPAFLDDVELAPVQDSELAVDDTIGRYRIVSLMGRGGMGTVYRAHDTRLNREVALKFLPSYLSADPRAQQRLLMEARAVAALDHPNVCKIHEIGEADDGRLFIAMPCYDGETLKVRLRSGPLAVVEAVTIAIQITRGLGAAHQRGIIHRDVKPGNVILGSDGTVRLLDFGLAMAEGTSLAGSPDTLGTIAYMSPEQARGETLDPRTDLWSVGVVLYEMLTGVRPFKGGNAPETLQAILHHDPERVSTKRREISATLAGVVERLLQKNPAKRYPGAAEVLADLERTLPSHAGPPRPSSARQRSLLAVGAVLSLVLLGGVVWRYSLDERRASASRMAQPSIAVLPLVNLSADSAAASLATGMTDELISTLSSSRDLRVIASTSVGGFMRRDIDLRKIADSLGVANILDGKLQKTGSRVHLEVRLVNGRDGKTRWSQSYDREFSDVFVMQEEIARGVAAELDLRFDKDRQLMLHHPRNMASYELYLRGSDPVLLRSQDGIWKAQEYFQQAIATDSTYAAAHAGLALVYVRRARNAKDPGMPAPKLFALAEHEARKAVALDATLAEAHYALGRVLEAALRLPSAEAAMRRAIALDPTRSVYRRGLLFVILWYQRPEQELSEARRAMETDPLNPYALTAVAGGLYGNRRYDEALTQLQRLATMKPPLQGVTFSIAQCYFKKHMLPEAIAALRPGAAAGEPLYNALLGNLLARAGQRDEAKRILADLTARREHTGSGAFHLAVVYAGLGDLDQVFAWLDKSIDDRSISSWIMGPTFEELHSDPRFELLKRRLGVNTT